MDEKTYKNIDELIDAVVSDESLTREQKAGIFEGWKAKISDNMENVLMDKDMAGKYFGMLESIENGIARV